MIKVNLDELKQLNKGLKSYDKKVMTVIRTYGKSSATTLANDAKRSAKWTDRTGQARRSIKGEYKDSGTLGTIRLEGYAQKPKGGDYFQYLEYAHKKKWAILRPTVDKALPRITDTMAKRIAKVKIM